MSVLLIPTYGVVGDFARATEWDIEVDSAVAMRRQYCDIAAIQWQSLPSSPNEDPLAFEVDIIYRKLL